MAETPEPGGLSLSAREQEAFLNEIQGLLDQLPPHDRQDIAAIHGAASRGYIPANLLPLLEDLLWMLLESGQVRARQRAAGEQILHGLFRRTPGGQELASRLGELNTALGTLSGATLHSVTASVRRPGCYLLTLELEHTTVTLVASRAGLHLERVVV